VSGAAATLEQPNPFPRPNSATPALDTDGSAPLPRLLTANDVAKVLRVPRSFVYALARRGELPMVRIGDRYVRFRRDALERWIEGCETTERRGTQ
jgi:excisionase family DNA binding protein